MTTKDEAERLATMLDTLTSGKSDGTVSKMLRYMAAEIERLTDADKYNTSIIKAAGLQLETLRTANAKLRDAAISVIAYDESDPDDGVTMMLNYADALAKCRDAVIQGAKNENTD